MSTMVRGELAEKKISSWVRPGVCEVRARALRLVKALIRLELPTLSGPPCNLDADRLRQRFERAAAWRKSQVAAKDGARPHGSWALAP